MKNKRIYLSPPHMGDKERNYLTNAFDSNCIAPLGPHVDGFENEMAEYLGVNHASALSSGSGALHLALKIVGVEAGDKVLCPSLTFAASANVIMYEKAQPIFVDSDQYTWVVDLNALEKAIKKNKPKAFIPVDLYGQSCDYDAILDLCNQYNVIVIEDAAEALGASYLPRGMNSNEKKNNSNIDAIPQGKDKKCGSFGEIGILSFNGNKIITTSGGGISLGFRIIHKEFYKRIDLPKLILELADEKILRLFILGAEEEINQKAVENIKVKYPNIKIVGRQNGYYENIGDIIELLKETKPQVAFVALGSPKQELLSAKLHKLLNGIIFIGCGGALDVFGGKAKRPPAIIGDNHLEWLYRLIMNPKRIIRQKVLPKYLFHVIKARLNRNNYLEH